MNRLVVCAFFSFVFLISSINASAENACSVGSRVYFELPFSGEAKYSESGKRLPRGLIGSSGRVSFCTAAEDGSELHEKISKFLHQGVGDKKEGFKILSLVESFELTKVLYVGEEVFAFVYLEKPNRPKLLYPIALLHQNDKLSVSNVPMNRNLLALLTYVLQYDKPSAEIVGGDFVNIVESKSNQVLLHADILFPDADEGHPIFSKIREANLLIEKGEYDTYLSLLDPFSKQKNIEYLDSLAPDKKTESANFAFSIPIIEYIVDADPVYFIAYTKNAQTVVTKRGYQESVLFHQFFYGQRGKARPWNSYFDSPVTELLSSFGFFQQVERMKSQ